MTRAGVTGAVESHDGWWLVTWNHDHTGYSTYEVESRDDGSRYVAHVDEGRWLWAPSYLTTVDMEQVIPRDDPDLASLLDALDRAREQARL